jgi:hypothetical protein
LLLDRIWGTTRPAVIGAASAVSLNSNPLILSVCETKGTGTFIVALLLTNVPATFSFPEVQTGLFAGPRLRHRKDLLPGVLLDTFDSEE